MATKKNYVYVVTYDESVDDEHEGYIGSHARAIGIFRTKKEAKAFLDAQDWNDYTDSKFLRKNYGDEWEDFVSVDYHFSIDRLELK